MTIRRKLFVIGISPLLVGIIIAGSLAWLDREVKRALAVSDVAADVLSGVVDLNTLTYEYLRTKHGRPAMQWDQKQKSLAALLAEQTDNPPDVQSELDQIRDKLDEAGRHFAQIEQLHAAGAEAPTPDKADQWEQRLAGQLLMRTRGMVSNADHLNYLSHQQLNRTRSTANRLIMVLCVVLLLVVGVVAISLGQNITKAVERLKAGAERIAEGDLDHSVDLKSRDELGLLAQDFNRMAGRLKALYQALGTEVEQRRTAECDLKELNLTLEQRVRQRTKELDDAQRSLLNMMQDIEQARAKLARNAEKLKRSNEDLEQFAYVASHDLQEPLRKVASFCELIKADYREQLDDKGRQYIDYAVDGAVRMKTLINDLLSLSRIGTRGRVLEPTDAGEACARAIDVLHDRIAESGAVVETGELPTVRADKMQLAQLFQNLIGNAIKYRGDRTPQIRIDANQREGEWVFSVRDNGIGIDPKFADRVFVIFQRLHGRGEYEGTGIGLAICKKIVERMGGRIWVESQPGEGATFFFTARAEASPP